MTDPARKHTAWSEADVERTLGTLASLNPVTADAVADAAAQRRAGTGGRTDGTPMDDGAPTHSPGAVPGADATAADGSSTGATSADAGGGLTITIDDIYRSHRMGMVRLAILLVDDLQSAEDVVQEAFAGLYKNWSRLRDRRAAIGYLRMSVVNGARSMLRRRRTARAYVPPDAGTARSAESLAMMSAEHQAVVAALAELPERQREVLVLRYYGGLSEAEIAEATGVARGTVKSTASRAIAKLTEAMEAMRTGH